MYAEVAGTSCPDLKVLPTAFGSLDFGTVLDAVICLECNKNLWSRRSMYKSYGALRVRSGGNGSSPGVVYSKDSGVARQCDAR